MKHKVCVKCGVALTGAKIKYCSDCSYEAKKENAAKYSAQKKAERRKLRNKNCLICGEKLEAKQTKYCTKCKEIGNKIKAKNLLDAKKQEKIKKIKNSIDVAIKELKEFNSKRKEQGLEPMSYGKWVEYNAKNP